MQPIEAHLETVNRAFSAQSLHYDEADLANPVLQQWRRQVYDHVHRFLAPGASILELNAGTGIDALYFSNRGHQVLATDLSGGMIERIQEKITSKRTDNLAVQQISYDQLQSLQGQKFDYIFSNFGGLNCIQDLSVVTQSLEKLLNPDGFVTCVIMPHLSLWELSWMLKGQWKKAFRRWNRDGALAHVEGEHFTTYYHSLSKIKKAFGPCFKFVKSEGLGVLTPPPGSSGFVRKNPEINLFLNKLDRTLRHSFPFNRWGDHIIVTFQRS